MLRRAGAALSAYARRPAAWVILTCVLALTTTAQTARAHASLIDATPAAGAVLPAPPTEVSLRFNEPVSPLVVTIIWPDGRAQPAQQVQARDGQLRIAWPALSGSGTYAVSWRVVSADGHPVAGSLTFSIGERSALAAPVTEGPPPERAAGLWLSRLIWIAGLIIAVGAAVLHGFSGAQGGRRAGQVALGLGTLGALAHLGLQGVDALNLPLSGLLDSRAWIAGAGTALGTSVAFALVALACAAAAWWVRPAASRVVAAAALVLLGAALASSGHAASAPPTWLARPTVWLHAVAVTLWIGALVPLAAVLSGPSGAIALRRFSRHIVLVLAALLASGAVLTWLQLDAFASLWRTGWGQILTAKLALVAALLALGAFNRYGLTGKVLLGQARARHLLGRVMRVEIVLGLVILALVAAWRLTPPPRAQATGASMPLPLSRHLHTPDGAVELVLTFGRHGEPARLTLALKKPDMTPLAAQEVVVVFRNAASGIEPIALSARTQGDGRWRIDAVDLPALQVWQLRVEVLVSDFERIGFETSLEFPR